MLPIFLGVAEFAASGAERAGLEVGVILQNPAGSIFGGLVRVLAAVSVLVILFLSFLAVLVLLPLVAGAVLGFLVALALFALRLLAALALAFLRFASALAFLRRALAGLRSVGKRASAES